MAPKFRHRFWRTGGCTGSLPTHACVHLRGSMKLRFPCMFNIMLEIEVLKLVATMLVRALSTRVLKHSRPMTASAATVCLRAESPTLTKHESGSRDAANLEHRASIKGRPQHGQPSAGCSPAPPSWWASVHTQLSFLKSETTHAPGRRRAKSARAARRAYSQSSWCLQAEETRNSRYSWSTNSNHVKCKGMTSRPVWVVDELPMQLPRLMACQQYCSAPLSVASAAQRDFQALSESNFCRHSGPWSHAGAESG